MYTKFSSLECRNIDNSQFQRLENFDNAHSRSITSFMSNKTKVIDVVRRMPAKASLQDIYEKVAFMAGVEAGLDQLRKGLGIPLKEVKREISTWVSKSSLRSRSKTSL
jgi:predicted transcriptional regulator